MNSTIEYQGKAKNVHSTDESNVLRLEYLDQATALNGKKKDSIIGKGSLNNQITSLIFAYLTENGIKNHWLKQFSDTEQLVERVTIIPIEVVLRNIATGSFTKRLGIKEGTTLPNPIIEFYFKDDSLDDPFINEDHIKFLRLATEEEVDYLKEQTLKINQLLIQLFKEMNITLVDFKLEFGKDSNGAIILSDEITPDTCRLWDKNTGKSLDKDVYRKDLGEIVPVYEEILMKLKKKRRVIMFKIRVYVGYKESVLDPQAEVIESAINRLGHGKVSDVKIGKFFDFKVDAVNEAEALKIADKISDELLANVNMESYKIQILEEK